MSGYIFVITAKYFKKFYKSNIRCRFLNIGEAWLQVRKWLKTKISSNTHSTTYWSFLSAVFEMGIIRMLGIIGRSDVWWLRCCMSFFLLQVDDKQIEELVGWKRAWNWLLCETFPRFSSGSDRSANHNSLATPRKAVKRKLFLEALFAGSSNARKLLEINE